MRLRREVWYTYMVARNARAESKKIMIISDIKLRTAVSGAQDVAFCGGKEVEGGVEVAFGETADFTTFFNAFDAEFFREYTSVEEVKLKLDFTGRACVVIIRYFRNAKPKRGKPYSYERVAACVSEGGCEIAADVKRGGILGFVLKAESDVLLRSGSWECDDSCKKNDVRAGFVICTYKREKDAIKNAKTLCEAVENADVYVVDNGNTLTKEDLPEGARLIRNRNLGGSGGFSRGMIECIDRADTHCILVDDDAVADKETARRTIRILELLKEEKKNVSIGGAMFSFSSPSVVYEAGAYAGKSKLRFPKSNIEIADKSGLLNFTAKAEINYCGWWYCCVPVSVIEKSGLSMPFFIKYDDIEFGMRTSKETNLVCPLGIGVWHQDFETKLPPYIYYYLRRNALITNAVTGKGSLAYAFFRLWGSVAMFLKKDKKTLSYVFDGFDDYLEGAEFLENVDGEELNEEVRNAPRKQRGVFSSVCKAIALSVKLMFLSRKVNACYREKRDGLCSAESWRKRLDLITE